MVNRTAVNGYSADQGIAANTTYSTAGTKINCNGLTEMFITPKATGANASSAGNVTFTIETTEDDINWTEGVSAIVALAGVAAKTATEPYVFRCGGLMYMRIKSCANGDATYAITGANCIFRGSP